MYRLKLTWFIIQQFSLLGLYAEGAQMMHCYKRAAKAEACRQLITLALHAWWDPTKDFETLKGELGLWEVDGKEKEEN